jgi:hypothetical protein
MDKTQAMGLLKEIVAVCPALDMVGFYTRAIRFSSNGDIELRLLATLDADSRKNLGPMLANHRLTLIEEKGLLIIY